MVVSKLEFAVCSLLGIGLSITAVAQDVVSSSGRPNVVLIVADDHGRDDLGCYGSRVIKTPNLDRLAAEGIRMTNAYCTTASSSASRSVILTGMYNHATGQYGHAHSFHHFSAFPEIKSLPQYLKKAGYRTGRIGKFHVAPESVFEFDTILGREVSERNPFDMAEHCAGFIQSAEESPFFLYFCTGDPHRSDQVVDDSPYKPDRFGNRDEGYEGIIPTYYKPGKMEVPTYLPDSPECRAELAQYAQSVSRMDLGLGRLFELLRKTGQWDKTLIIYLSDNGIAFAGAKTTLYDPGMHLPCIIKLPFKSESNRTCDAMITWADITPTILDFSKALPDEAHFHGRSFVNALTEEHPQGWDEVFASNTFHEVTMYYPMRVVQNRQYKLIWNIAWQLPFPFSTDLWSSATWQGVVKSGAEFYGKRRINQYLQRPKFEMYDLKNDPDEVVNLADNSSFTTVLESMKAELKDFQVKTNDPWILKWMYD